MKLLNIITENFKKLGNYSTEFKAGLNVISGDNAQGKSTLLEAVKMALFGVSAVPGKKENIPTWGQSKVSVTLTFQMSELDVYTLVRTLTTAKLTKNNLDGTKELKANGHTPVTLFIEELTGLTIKDWELFIQSSQGSAAGILTFGAAALNRKVEEFAGVDLIDKIQTLAQQRAGTIGARAEAKLVPEDRLQELRAQLDQAMADEESAQVELNNAQAAFDNLPPKPVKVEGETAAELRAGQKAVDVASAEVDKAEASVSHAQQRVNDLAERLEGREPLDFDALTEQLKALEVKGIALGEKDKAFKAGFDVAARAEDEAATLLEELEGAKAALASDPSSSLTEDDLQRDLAAANEYIVTTKADIARETEVVGAATSTYNNLIKLADGATCPTCKRAKEDHDPVALAQEAEAAKKYMAERKLYVSKLMEDLLAFEDSKKAAEKHLAAKNRLTATVDGLSSSYAAASLRAENLRDQVTADADQAAEVYRQWQQTREEFAETRQKLRDAQEKNEALELDHRTLRSLESELEACIDHLNDANKVLEELPEAASDEEVQAAEEREKAYTELVQAHVLDTHNLCNALSRATEVKARAAADTSRAGEAHEAAVKTNADAASDVAAAKRCERLVRFLRDRRQTYLKEVWDTVMGVSSSLVRKSSNSLITKLDNKDGDFFFEEEGISAPTVSASGAQKALIGTSIRMGLSRALYGGDALMIFDEPTEGCTELNAANMVATLATSAKQVLLITHRENDQALAQHIINVG